MENAIKDNRIVNDYTFATRFKRFLKGIRVNDMGSEEELEYFKTVAKKLLGYQVVTVEIDSDEFYYLARTKKSHKKTPH